MNYIKYKLLFLRLLQIRKIEKLSMNKTKIILTGFFENIFPLKLNVTQHLLLHKWADIIREKGRLNFFRRLVLKTS